MGDRNKEKELLSHHLFGLFSLTKCRQKSIEGAFATTSGANVYVESNKQVKQVKPHFVNLIHSSMFYQSFANLKT
jgi:hypothetical protein